MGSKMKQININDDTYNMLINYQEEFKIKENVNISFDFIIWKLFIQNKFRGVADEKQY
jgi:predicted CopG family antitoxin